MRAVSGLVGLVNKVFGKGRLENINDLLPDEVLAKIFHLLAHRDLKVGKMGGFEIVLTPKAVVLVCQRWRRVGEDKRLWSWVSLRADNRNLDLMPEMLCSKRLQSANFLHVRISMLQ